MKEFDEYIKTYDLSNYDIDCKRRHSYRVSENSERIARMLKLSNEDIELAKIIGLLHDIGRFEQLKKYNCFWDYKSIDHGYYGAKVLFGDNLIEKFNIDKKYFSIIEKAIINHNKLNIEENLSDKELLHSKIIRDADKIDILNLFTDSHDYSITDNLDDVSLEVENQFFSKSLISDEYIVTKSDEMLRYIAFCFNFYFKESIDILKEKRYIEKMYEQIEDKNKYKKYFDFVFNYINEEVK